MKMERRSRAFLWAVVALGVAAMGYSAATWPARGATNLLLVLVLLGLAVTAVHFPLAITPRQKVDLTPAVYFASLLLLGGAVAVLLVAASRLIGESTLCLRRNPATGKRRRDPLSMVFNTGQMMLTTAVGAGIYFALLPATAPAHLWAVQNLWALPLTAGAMFSVNSLAVAVMAGLHLHQSPLRIWLEGRRKDGFQPFALYGLGLVTAISSEQFAWTPLLMVLPAWVVYMSLRRMFNLVLVEQTVSAVEAMADIVDMRDSYTFEHSKRVADYAVRIARRMGLPTEEIETIRLAARVHDLGKIGVPDRILNKAGKLDLGERRLVEKHPEIGYQILSRFPEYRHGKDLVLSHHERFDGQGYPNRRSGRRLPMGAQVIAVADALDAMTSERPYRDALTLSEALAVFRREKGQQWHPEVVQALELLFMEAKAADSEEMRLPGSVGAQIARDKIGHENGINANLPIRHRLAEKLEVRPASLETLDYEVASAILASLDKMDRRLKRLDQEAALDELTGVLRRRAGLAALEREVARAHRSPGGELALAFIDVDGLKTVNDSEGHAAGDRLLREVSNALRRNLRRQDLVFRYGGDEFVCVLTEVGFASAWQKLNEVRAELGAMVGREPFSIGLAALREGETAEQLVARADGALYAERRLRRGSEEQPWRGGETAPALAVGPLDKGEWVVIEGTLNSGAAGG